MIYTIDVIARRNQTEKMLSKILDQRVEIRFADEVELTCVTVDGFTGPAVHQLISAGGQQPVQAIVVSGRCLDPAEDAAEMCVDFDAIVLHEAGHVAVHGLPVTDGQMTRDTAQQLCNTPASQWPSQIGPAGVKWVGHDFKFIRALLHVRHRMVNRRHAPLLQLAFRGELYGLSEIDAYRTALGSEPSDNDWLPLRDVLRKQPPKEFIRLWEDDVVRSLGLKVSRKEEVTC
ncbi:MAG: hypothetical protein ABGZ35_03560 [Planctomycetaceae bacterium]